MGEPKDDAKDDGGQEGSVTRADDLDPEDRGYGSGGAGYGGAGTGAGQGEPGSGGAGRPDERPTGQGGSIYDPGSGPVSGAGPEAGEVQGADAAPQIEASPEDGESQDEIALSSTNTRPPSDVETQESTGTDDKPGAGL